MGIKKKSKIGILGLVLSILGLLTCSMATIPGLICSIIGIKRKNYLAYSWTGVIVACICIALVARSYTFTGIEIDCPDRSGHIVFLRKCTHPFLAEYDRKIRFETNTIKGVTKPLPINCGGRTKINVYWYKAQDGNETYLRLQDHWGEYMIDLERGLTQNILRIDGRVFVGDISDDTVIGLGWEKTDGKLTKMYAGESEAKEITGEPHSLPGKYIGRIDGTHGCPMFISVDESEEEYIEMVH